MIGGSFMLDAADRRIRTVHVGAQMRPRRWYADEVAPRCRNVKLPAQLWRYPALAYRRTAEAAPAIGAASAFYQGCMEELLVYLRLSVRHWSNMLPKHWRKLRIHEPSERRRKEGPETYQGIE